uniref:Uncharacterized protein n=1 Tax=Acrobeloides nanus TaxID=290746 RepID=A0A914DBA2_9BILA
MPLQYVVMAFFSSTVAQIQTLQVIWYWNRPPPERQENFEPKITTLTCNLFRTLGIVVFTTEIVIFAASLLLRTQNWWFICAPIVTYAVIASYYVYSINWCPMHVRISTNEEKENKSLQ